jgi:uncharacterized paraquat-inducible protein A
MHQVVCPACGKALNISDTAHQQSLTCPRCLARLADPAPSQSEAFVDREVHRDMKGTGCALMVLSALACLGVFINTNLLIGMIIESSRSVYPVTEAKVQVIAIQICTDIAGVVLLATSIYLGITLFNPRIGARLPSRLQLSGMGAIGCLALVSAYIVFFVGCTAATLQSLNYLPH